MVLSYIFFSILHLFQFALALTVCGLYGVDLDRARKAGVYADGKWVRVPAQPPSWHTASSHGDLSTDWQQVYAVVVGGLSALTAILYCIPFILRFALVWAWNLILFILWIALFGVFGSVRTPSYLLLDPPPSRRSAGRS